MARRRGKAVTRRRSLDDKQDPRRSGRRRRRRVTLMVLGLVALASTSWALIRSPLFALDGIKISGTRLLTQDDILQLSGLRIGQNVLSVHPGEVEARLRRIPLVKEVSVIRLYPSRVRIVIVERDAAFVLVTQAGGWLLDSGGTVLTRFSEVSPGLPTIVVSGEIAASTGSRVRQPAVVRALGLWRALPNDLREGATGVEVGIQTGAALIKPDLRIEFGTTDRLDEKIDAARLVLEEATRQGKKVSELDVSAPLRPAARIA